MEAEPIVRRLVKLTALAVISGLILAGIVWVVGFQRTAQAVRQAGLGAFAVVGATMLPVLLLHTGAWAALNRPVKHKVSFRTLFEAVVVGLAGNILTPSTHLGGEPFKVVYVGRTTGHPYHEVAGTVLLSKYLEGLSFVLFFSLSTFVAAVSFRTLLFGPHLVAGVLLLVVAAGLLGLFVVLWLSLSRRWLPLTRLVAGLAHVRLFPRFFGRLVGRTRRMEEQVSRVFWAEGGAARLAFGAFVVGHALVFVRPGLFFLLARPQIALGLRELCLIFVASQALLAFQLTPSGVGMLDGGLIGTFALLGLDGAQHAAQCMAYLLCIRFWDALLVSAGVLLAARVGAGILTAKPPPTTELLESNAADDEAD